MRGTKIGIISIAAAGLVLTGCSSGDDTTTPQATSGSDSSAPDESPSGGASDDLVSWAGDLCGAVGPFEDRFTGLQTLQPTDPTDLSGYVEQVQETFGSMGSLFADAHDAIEESGPPPVGGGDEIYANLLAALEAAVPAFETIGTQLAAIDPNDPNAMTELSAVLQNLTPQLESSTTALESAFSAPAMEAAFAAAPECEGITGSGS